MNFVADKTRSVPGWTWLPAGLRRWLNTFRVRLTLWSTGLVILSVLSALVVVREGLRYFLTAELAQVLRDEARELRLKILAYHPDQQRIIRSMELKAAGHRDRRWEILWLTEDRSTVLFRSGVIAEDEVQQLHAAMVSRTPVLDSSEDNSVRLFESERFRAAELTVALPNGPTTHVRVGSPLDYIESDVAQVTRLLGGVGLVLCLLAPLGGAWLAGQAIGPLQEIIRTTERIRPRNLSERLTVRGTDDELDQLAIKINQFLDQIAEHLQRNQDFLANAAHELRSPLAAIQSSVEVHLARKRTTEEYEDLLEQVNEECRQLSHLINQLLVLVESEAPVTTEFAKVRLDEVVQRVIDIYEPVAESQQVLLQGAVAAGLEVRGEAGQLRQVLINLIDNAIKFTPAGGRVVITLQPAADPQQVELIVSDTGIGLAEHELTRVFERFYQVDKSRKRLEGRGTGLGLSICRALVVRHGGQIRVSSAPGRGSSFTVTLPCWREPRA